MSSLLLFFAGQLATGELAALRTAIASPSFDANHDHVLIARVFQSQPATWNNKVAKTLIIAAVR